MAMQLIPLRRRFAVSPQIRARRGFTLVEVMVTLVLFVVLATGVLWTITTMHKISRHQATYNSVMALILSEQENIRAQAYTPPTAPFTAMATKTSQTKSVSLNSDGTKYMVEVTLVTTIEPISSGHKVTVIGSYSQNGRSPSISTTTLINKYSSVGIW